jgi:enterochelin esterase-like enzyme
VVLAIALLTGIAHAQAQTEVPAVIPGAKPVSVERIRVHGVALEGNLEGNEVDREVLVFLPPGYKTGKRRYPVVYALHGFFIGAEQWTHEIHMPQTIEGAFALGVLIADVERDRAIATQSTGSVFESGSTTIISRAGCARDTSKLHQALDQYGIAHGFEIYAGTHTSKLGARSRITLKFFSENRCSEKNCPWAIRDMTAEHSAKTLRPAPGC